MRLLKLLSILFLVGFTSNLFSQANGNYQWILNQDGAITNDILRWDGTGWKPATITTVGGVTGTAVARQVGVWLTSTDIGGDTSFVFDASKRLSLGRSFSESNSRLTIFGTNTTVGTFAFTHYSSDGIKKADLTNSGVLRLYNSSGANALSLGSGSIAAAGSLDLQANSSSAAGMNINNVSGGITITNTASHATYPVFTLDGNTKTSTTQNIISQKIITGFAPTASGTNTYTTIEISPTINQTGGHTGISYGSRYAPILTAAADWRSIQIDNASGYGIYQSNSGADNYFAGQVGIGTVPSGSNILTISGGVKMDLGSDATGDIYRRNSSGVLERIPIGIANQVLTVSGGLPTWQNSASGADNWGSQVVVKDSSLVNWGTSANPLGIRGYGAASNGQVPSKATGGITWITPTTGTVTNFSAGDLSPLFTTSEATTTTTPALTFALTNAGAHTYFGNATGSTGAPSYTSNAALSKTDDTNVTLTLGGAPTTSLLEAVSLTLGWTGQLSVSRGGSGVGTLTGLLQGNGTSAFTAITNSSTTGQVLRVTGASTYAWGALDLANTNAVTGVLDETNGGTGQSTIATGDILYGSSSNTLSKLTIGASTTYLKGGTTPSWATLNSAALSDASNIALLNGNQTFSGTNVFSALTTTSNEASTFASTVTTNATTLAGTSSHIYLNIASAGSSITLPADANVSDGEIIEIMNLNSNAVDIIPNTGQTINEVASQISDMPQYGHIVLKARLVSTVAHWMRWE